MEKWKKFRDTYYEVSSEGNVRNVNSGRTLKHFLVADKYRTLKLRIKGVPKNFRISRLVAECFIPNPENKPQVDHIDRNTFNDSVNNLRWATVEENAKNRAMSKVTLENVRRIYKYTKEGFSPKEIFDILNS